MKDQTIKELIGDVREKIQFLITVAIFYAAFVAGYLELLKPDKVEILKHYSIFAMGVGLYVLLYLFLDVVREKRILLWVKGLVCANIVCLALLVTTTAFDQFSPIFGLNLLLFKISLVVASWLPWVLFIGMFIYTGYIFIDLFSKKGKRIEA